MKAFKLGFVCFVSIFFGCSGERFVQFQPPVGIIPDNECPSVSVKPSSGAQNVPLSQTIRIDFSEPMERETIGTENIYLMTGANIVRGSLEFLFGDTLAFLYPAADLAPDTEYKIVVRKAVRDLAGNALCSALNSSFRTESLVDDDCPNVISFYPPSGAMDVSLETEIVVNLDEPIDERTVTSQTFYVMEDGNEIPASISIQNGLTFKLRPTNLLRPNKTHTTVVTNVKDLAGNLLCETRVWSFTTGEAPDTECPRVVSSNPLQNEVDVPPGTDIKVSFTEAMKPSTFTPQTFRLRSENADVSGTFTFSAGATIAVFNPTFDLNLNRTYALLVTDVADAAGNFLCETFSLTFKTEGIADTIAPRLTQTRPQENAEGVLPQIVIEANFSEPIDPASWANAFELRDALGRVVRGIPNYIDGPGNVATFTPDAPLVYGARYDAEVGTEIRDLFGNQMTAPYMWYFTVVAEPDNVCPIATDVLPQSGDLEVSVSAPIRVTFSEPMNPATITSQTFVLKKGNVSVPGEISFALGNTVAILDPVGNLENETFYTVTVTTGAEDAAGNSLCEAFFSVFKTEGIPPCVPNWVCTEWSACVNGIQTRICVDGNNCGTNDGKPEETRTCVLPDSVPPYILLTNPRDGDSNVPVTTNIRAFFSEAINPASLNFSFFLRKPNGDHISGTIALTEENTLATFTPNSNLEPNANYIATVTNNVRDFAGNNMENDYVWMFTTVGAPPCTPNWVCTEWSACVDGIQTRTCVDQNNCGTNDGRPPETQTCTPPCDPYWICTEWSDCVDSVQTRVCTDQNNCGTNEGRPPESQPCTPPCTPDWVCTDWSACIGGIQTRTCIDQNECGTNEGKPQEWQECTPSDTTSPYVIVTEPQNFTQDVPLNQIIRAIFSESMDLTSLNTSTFKVKKGNEFLTGTVGYANGVASFAATSPLDFGTSYIATVTTGAKDLAGNPMVQDYVWTFETVMWFNPEPVNLASAVAYAVLAGSAVRNSGATSVFGNLGVNPGTEVSGFPPGTVNGEIHIGDAFALQAWYDARAAYNDIANRTQYQNIVGTGELGGLTLVPGLYKTGSANLLITSEDLTLDAQSNSNAIWIFQSPSALVVQSNRKVLLTNGARAENVFWAVNGSVTLDSGSLFKGNLLILLGPATLQGNAILDGRVLVRNGDVILNTNTVTKP